MLNSTFKASAKTGSSEETRLKLPTQRPVAALPKMPSPVGTPEDTTSNEHILLSGKYASSTERTAIAKRFTSTDQAEFNDLDALIRREQDELHGDDSGSGSGSEDEALSRGPECNFMKPLQRDPGRNKPTLRSLQPYACVFSQRGQYKHSELGNENKI